MVFEELKPEVRFTGKGTILPSTDGLVMPFEAVNLKSVDLEVIRIYESNVLQFLQVNALDGNQELHDIVFKSMIPAIALVTTTQDVIDHL